MPWSSSPPIFWIVGFLQPTAQYAYQQLRFELSSGGARRLHQGRRVHPSRPRHDDARRAQRKITAPSFYGVVPAHRQPQTAAPSPPRPIAAPFSPTDDPEVILFRLTNGRLGQQPARLSGCRALLSFQQHDLPINMPAIENFRGPRRRHQGAHHLRIVPARQRCLAARGPAQRDPRQFPFPPWSRWAMMLLVPLPCGGACGAAQEKHVGPRHLRRDHLRGRLSQGEPICRADGERWGGSTRPSPCGRPFLVFGGSIVLDVLHARPISPAASRSARLERVFARIAKLVGRLLRRRRRAAVPA